MYPTDDVLAAVPEQKIFFITANYIIAPIITDVGKYKTKKIGYRGYKALAHLHPNHFKPEENKLRLDLRGGIPYYLIRCTGFMATMLTYNTNSKTGPVCGGRASYSTYSIKKTSYHFFINTKKIFSYFQSKNCQPPKVC